MITSIDIEYYEKRAAQERALANRTSNPQAHRSHAELAERYSQMAATPLTGA